MPAPGAALRGAAATQLGGTSRWKLEEGSLTRAAGYLPTKVKPLNTPRKAEQLKEELGEEGLTQLIDKLDRHKVLLSFAWDAIDLAKTHLSPFDAFTKEPDQWEQYAPSKGAARRVRQGTRRLLVCWIIFHFVKTLCVFVIQHESGGARTPACAAKMGAARQLEEDSSHAGPLSLAVARLNSGFFQFNTWGVIAPSLALFAGVFVWLCFILRDIVFRNLYLPGVKSLFQDLIVVQVLAMQLIRLWVVFYAYRYYFTTEEGDATAVFTVIEQVTMNVVLLSYFLLDVARQKAPHARMLLCIMFVVAMFQEYMKRKNSDADSECGNDLLRYAELQAPTGYPWFDAPVFDTPEEYDGVGEANATVHGEAEPETITIKYYNTGNAHAALYYIDSTTFMLMIKGVLKTFLRPHHCSFLVIPQTLNEIIVEDKLSKERRMMRGQRRAEKLQLLVLSLLPRWCYKAGRAASRSQASSSDLV